MICYNSLCKESGPPWPPTCAPNCPPTHQLTHPLTHPPTNQLIYMSTCRSTHPPTSPFACPPAGPPTHLHTHSPAHQLTAPPAHPSTQPPVNSLPACTPVPTTPAHPPRPLPTSSLPPVFVRLPDALARIAIWRRAQGSTFMGDIHRVNDLGSGAVALLESPDVLCGSASSMQSDLHGPTARPVLLQSLLFKFDCSCRRKFGSGAWKLRM